MDFNGIEHALLSPCEIQHLKKYREGAEVLIIRSGEYPYVVMLPDYAAQEIFPILPPPALEEIGDPDSAKYFTFDEWYSNVRNRRDGFRFPYPNR